MVEAVIRTKTGKIYIGDICYALDDEIYDKFWGDEYCYADGVFDYKTSQFVVSKTAYGDGEWEGSDKHTYFADAGNIGIVPGELIGKDKTNLDYGSRLIEADEATFKASDGEFWITVNGETIYINTREDELEEEIDYADIEEEEKTIEAKVDTCLERATELKDVDKTNSSSENKEFDEEGWKKIIEKLNQLNDQAEGWLRQLEEKQKGEDKDAKN